jgi:putative membrane protein
MLMFGYDGMMLGYGMGYGYHFIFLRLLFWIAIIVLAYFVIKSLIKKNKTQGVVGKSALDIAKERYAKGEITKEELEEIKKNLV